MPRQYIWRTAGGVMLSGQILAKAEDQRAASGERRKRTSTETEWNGAKAKTKRCTSY